MKFLKGFLPVAALVLASFTGSAHASGYFALEGSALTFNNSSSKELNPGGMRLRVGTQLSHMLDIEGHLGLSFDEDTDEFEEFGATYYGIYLKGYLPVGYNSALFALGGMSNVRLSQSIGTGEFSESRGGFSYGFGMETRLTDNADLTADYMSYIRDEGLFEEISSVNFGIKLYF